MKKILLTIAGLAAFLLLSSCIKEADENNSGSVGDGFVLNYSLPLGAAQTYATIPVEQGEDEVGSLYLLFFPKTSGGTGTFIEMYDASPEQGNTYVSFGSIPVRFPPGSKLNTNTDYNILMVANLEQFIDTDILHWVERLNGKTEVEVANTFEMLVRGAHNSSVDDDTQSILPVEIPMSARLTKESTDSSVYVELQRTVSRFDVFNQAFDKTGHKLVSVSIWNAFPRTSIWGNGMTDYTVNTPRIERYYGLKRDHGDFTGEQVRGGLYAFENKVVNPEQDDLMTTCLIIGMEFGGSVSYYRVNVHPTGQGQYLLRNNAYQLTIQNVNGEGAPSEEDAYTSREVNLDYNINGWVIDNSGNIITDGNNILAIPSKKVMFNPLGGTQEFNIFTYGDGTLEIADVQLPSGISYSLVSKLLTITATSSEDTKAGYIELKFGSLRATIEVEQTGATERFLNLSTYDVPSFSFEAGMQMAGTINVAASGDWTATIFNGGDDCFTFTAGNLVTQWKKSDGDSFSLATYSANPSPSTRYCFVLVTLDEDKDISRVVVLSQNGTGDITVTPLTDVVFDFEGNTTSVTTFTVNAGGAAWDVILDGTNSSRFTVTKVGSGQFRIESRGPNTTAYPYTAVARARLSAAQGVYKEVNIIQRAQSLEVTPSISVDFIGNSTSAVTVTSSGDWTAAVTSSTVGGITFNDGHATASGSAGVSTFTVKFPLNLKNATPSATITVMLDGTSISKTVSAVQAKPVATTLNVRALHAAIYGSIVKSGWYNQQMYLNFRNSGYFGTNGTCYVQGFNWSESNTPDPTGSNIFQFVTDNAAWAATYGGAIASWTRASDKNILYLSGDQTCYAKCNALTGLGMTGTVHGSAVTYNRTINPSLTVDNSRILKFLLQDGPFTEGSPISASSISLRPNDGTNGTLSVYPATMEVIMWSPQYPGEVLLGIDPKQGIVFCGDTEIFHNAGEARNNYVAVDGPNMKFLNNLIAFMVYGAQYGEIFLEQFYR